LAWITALSMPPVAKELTIEPRFMFGTDRYMEAVNPQREPIPDRSHQHRGQYGLVDGMPVKIVATAQSGRPAMS